MLEKTKLALRITEDDFDAEIERLIEGARAELIRSGVSPAIVEEAGPLVTNAIITYVRADWNSIRDNKISDGLWESFRLMQEHLRKSFARSEE